MRKAPAAIASLALFAALTAGTAARAADPAAAEALFAQGKQLMANGRYAEACPKLEESQRLDPGMGTLFHLAECDERIGKTASAWAAYLEVAGIARAAKQPDREKVARDRAAALEPKLARLTLVATAAERTAGLEVKRNDLVIGKGQWGAPVPVDPGEYTVVATAPGKLAWEKKVVVPAAGRIAVDVPALRDAPVADAQSASTLPTTQAIVLGPGARSDGLGGQRIAALIVGGIGLAGLGVGTYFAVRSKSSHDDADAHCNGNACDATGVSMRDDAIHNGNAATVALGAGAAAVVGGIALWATAPSRSRESGERAAPATTATVGFAPTGMTVRGTF